MGEGKNVKKTFMNAFQKGRGRGVEPDAVVDSGIMHEDVEAVVAQFERLLNRVPAGILLGQLGWNAKGASAVDFRETRLSCSGVG